MSITSRSVQMDLVLASGSDDEIVRVWDVHTGTLLFTLDKHSGSVNYVVFSPDGKDIGELQYGPDRAFLESKVR